MDTVSPRGLLRIVKPEIFDYAQNCRKAVEQVYQKEVSCRSGCSFCCYQKLVNDVATGALIYLQLRQDGRWTPAMEKKLLEADRAMSEVSHRDWLALKNPCSFLREREFGRGECTVYGVRPMGCAGTYSFSEPQNCADPDGMDTLQANIDRNADRLNALTIDILDALGEQKVWAMTLPASVAYAAALCEGRPPPNVKKMDLNERNGAIDVEFDRR